MKSKRFAHVLIDAIGKPLGYSIMNNQIGKQHCKELTQKEVRKFNRLAIKAFLRRKNG
jgi:hypothetical protein